MIKKILKRIMIITISILVFLIASYFLFTNFYPSFGGSISEEDKKEYIKSKQYKDNKFHNTNPVPKELSLMETLNFAYIFFTTKVPNGRPEKDIEVVKVDSVQLVGYNNEARLFWFGHSSFMLQINGKTILIDPMFGKVAAPHPLLGAKRFNSTFPIEIEKLPRIDAVVYSHDHYDHLDYESVLKLKSKVSHFYVPLGVGTHLKAWGVKEDSISEMDWWESANLEGIELVCTPAQHFSGRKLSNGQSTLWSSWVIQSADTKLYFSGDSGYADHFKRIGEKYGPFDLALMECGQYNKMWPDIHMMPEETAIAGQDVKANKIMPIHWGGFKLALHSWTEPVERVKAKAKTLGVEVITPKIGQEILIKGNMQSFTNWWDTL
jgi:L-ascorbate metabolism protein UlaG (beta-lactamase superfamily)